MTKRTSSVVLGMIAMLFLLTGAVRAQESSMDVNGGLTLETGLNTYSMTDLNKNLTALGASNVSLGWEFGATAFMQFNKVFEADLGLSYAIAGSSYSVSVPYYYDAYYGNGFYYTTKTHTIFLPLLSLSFGGRYIIDVANGFYIKPGLALSLDSITGGSNDAYLASTSTDYWGDVTYTYTDYPVSYSGSTVGFVPSVAMEFLNSSLGWQLEAGFRISKITNGTATNSYGYNYNLVALDFSGFYLKSALSIYFRSPLAPVQQEE